MPSRSIAEQLTEYYRTHAPLARPIPQRRYLAVLSPDLPPRYTGPVVLWALEGDGWAFVQVLPTVGAGHYEAYRLRLTRGCQTWLGANPS